MKNIITSILLISITLGLSAQEEFSSISLSGVNPIPSVNGFRNALEFTQSTHAALVFHPGQSNELMFGMHSNGSFYWGTGGSATRPNYYSMYLNGSTGQLTLPKGSLSILGNSFNSRLTSNSLQFERNSLSYIDNLDPNGSIAIRTGGTGNIDLFINNEGNIGIGNTTPAAKLDVKGNIRVEAPGSQWIKGKTGTGGITSSTQLSSSAYHPLIRQETASGHYVNIGGLGDYFGFFGYDNDRTENGYDHNMTMNLNTGNVGIGTLNAVAKLEVKGNAIFDNGGNHTSLQLGSDTYDRIISDNRTDSQYGGGYWFRVHDEDAPFGYQDVMTLAKTGNVGIGIKNPAAKLDVRGNAIFDNGGTHTSVQFGNEKNDNIIADNSADNYYGGGYFFRVHDDSAASDYIDAMMIAQTGQIGIGTRTMGTHNLAVEGSIGAREIKVEATGWSDFVFEKNYKLPTLNDVESHIKENGHLKDIPSANDVIENGFYLGDMDSRLLQKIEELTLYTIDQEKRLNKIEQENQALKSTNAKLLELQSRLEKLEEQNN